MFDFPTTPATGTVVTVPDGSYRVWDSQKWRAAPSANVIMPPTGGTGFYSVQDAAFGAVGDGATNDTHAIQSAINAAAGHGALRFPATQATGAPAVYLSSFKLTVPSNSHLVIEAGATIKIANGANCDCFTFPYIPGTPTTNVLIELYGTLDGNMANNTTHGYGISVNGTGIPGTPNLTYNVCVRGDRLGLIKNFHNGPINWTTVTNSVVDGIRMDGGGSSAGMGGAKGYYSYNSGFSNCVVSNITDLGLGLYGGMQKGFIRNCEVFNCQSSGAFIFSDNGQPLPNIDCEIAGCELHDNGNYGIFVGSNATNPPTPLPLPLHKNCIIMGNHVYANANAGVQINYCDGLLFEGNYVHDNINGNQVLAQSGIYGDVNLRDSASRVSIVGNTITNPQIGRTDGKGYGIAFDSPDYLLISNNRIGDYQTTMSMTAAIGGNWGLRGLSEGNYYGPRINTAGYFPADLSYYQTSSRQGVNYDMVTPATSGLISAQGSPVFKDGLFPSQAITGVVPGRGLSIGWNKDLAQGTHHAGLGEVDLFVGNGLGNPGGFNFFQVQTIRITAGTYNSTTGAVSLTTSIPHTLTVGSAFKLTAVAGTFASDPTQVLKLNNAWTATTGTTGSTLNFTGPAGQDILSITGGAVVFSGEIEAGVVNTAVGVSGSLLANDGYGNTRLGGALVHGAMQSAPLVNGGTVTVNPSTSRVLIQNSTSIAAATISLPAPLSFQFTEGAELELNFQQPVGAVSWTGAPVVGPAPTVLSGGTSLRFIQHSSVWYPLLSDASGTPPVGGPYLPLAGGMVTGATTFQGHTIFTTQRTGGAATLTFAGAPWVYDQCAFALNYNYAGTTPQASITYLNYIGFASDQVAVAAGMQAVGFGFLHYFGGGGITGSRSGIRYQLSQQGACPANANYQAGWFTSDAKLPSGGTDLWTNSAGVLFGGGFGASLDSGGTNWRGVVGAEIDYSIASGASARAITGLQVFRGTNHAFQPAIWEADNCIIIGNSLPGAGAKFGFQFSGSYWGIDAANGRLMGADFTTNYTTTSPMQAAHGIDFYNVNLTGTSFRARGFSVLGSGASLGAGTVQVGNTYLSDGAVDTRGSTCTAVAIASGGANLAPATALIHDATGTLAVVTTVSGGVATAITLVPNTGFALTPPSNPVTFRVSSNPLNFPAAPTPPTLNLTWGTTNTLSLQPSGGAVQVGTGCIAANSSVATVLGSVGPVGSHTTVQEWFAIKNASGVTRYIPAF